MSGDKKNEPGAEGGRSEAPLRGGGARPVRPRDGAQLGRSQPKEGEAKPRRRPGKGALRLVLPGGAGLRVLEEDPQRLQLVPDPVGPGVVLPGPGLLAFPDPAFDSLWVQAMR